MTVGGRSQEAAYLAGSQASAAPALQYMRDGVAEMLGPLAEMFAGPLLGAFSHAAMWQDPTIFNRVPEVILHGIGGMLLKDVDPLPRLQLRFACGTDFPRC